MHLPPGALHEVFVDVNQRVVSYCLGRVRERA